MFHVKTLIRDNSFLFVERYCIYCTKNILVHNVKTTLQHLAITSSIKADVSKGNILYSAITYKTQRLELFTCLYNVHHLCAMSLCYMVCFI